MLIDLVEFDEAPYAETPLGAEKDAVPPAIILAILQRRAFFLTGAGISTAPPTRFHGGTGLATRLLELLQTRGLPRPDPLEHPDDLGEVCERLEAEIGRAGMVNLLQDVEDWNGAPFNLCHFVIAMLFAEGVLTRSFTLNWDPKVTQATRVIHGSRISSPCDLPTLEVGAAPFFVHMHGDMDHPASLVATSTQVGEPSAMTWTQPLLEAAMLEGEVVLVGFGAEPEYILDSLKKIRNILGRPALAIVSHGSVDDFVSGSPVLAEVSGVTSDRSKFLPAEACEFFGEVLRSLYHQHASETLGRAIDLAERVSGEAMTLTDAARQRVESLMLDQSVYSLIRFSWRAAALSDERPPWTRIPILRNRLEGLSNILAVLLVLASCADVDLLEMHDDGLRLRSTDDGQINLWPVVPHDQSHAAAALTAVVEKSGSFSRVGEAETPLVLVLAHTVGIVPPPKHVRLIPEQRRGRLAGPVRVPSDALDIAVLEARLLAVNGTTPTRVRDLVDLVP